MVIRPSRPLPLIAAELKFCSAINFAAEGAALTAADAPLEAAGADFTSAAASGATTVGVAVLSSLAINCSATTVAPSGCSISVNTPAEGAGTSKTTLSVSISIRISSWATASPGFFRHFNKVASVTDSESCGTLTSNIDISFPKIDQSTYLFFVTIKPFNFVKAELSNDFCCS